MTSVMRSNLYCFWSSISVDFMKRKTNVHLWPYWYSSVLFHLGKNFTCELEEVLIHLILNRQINLVKEYNKQILIQASQMRITKKNIKNAKQHPMLLEASNKKIKKFIMLSIHHV